MKVSKIKGKKNHCMYCLLARLLSCQNKAAVQNANAILECISELFLAETGKWKALILFYNA